MRTRLVVAVLAAAVSAALAGPAAVAAAPAQPVPPGTYKIANAAGRCLEGGGVFNAPVSTGECDTDWQVVPGDEGLMIRNAHTGNCMGMALQRIYPPMVATIPCGQARPWTFQETGEGRSAVVYADHFYLTDEGEGQVARLFPPNGGPEETQQWVLQRV